MRIALAAVLALAITAPAFAADVPEGAQPAVDAVKMLIKGKTSNIRKLKVTASGDVCGLARGTGDDKEFYWTKATGVVWLNEDAAQQNSDFVYSAPGMERSTERAPYNAWKACQKG
ncbi:MAG: hypothetical protein KA105_02400 [Caulobacter sp.]|nr:hypothetical protein [Caulobacter sp.]